MQATRMNIVRIQAKKPETRRALLTLASFRFTFRPWAGIQFFSGGGNMELRLKCHAEYGTMPVHEPNQLCKAYVS